MIYAAAGLIFAGMAMAFCRLLIGPSAQDRLNAAGVIAGGVTLYVLTYILETNCLLAADIVLLYAILGFTSTAVFSFYLQRGD